MAKRKTGHMSILLIILKIIGILILAVIFFIAIFLFHPIFYQTEGNVEEEWCAEGYFWWLFQILRLEFKLENDEMQWSFYFFGRQRKSGDKEQDEGAEPIEAVREFKADVPQENFSPGNLPEIREAAAEYTKEHESISYTQKQKDSPREPASRYKERRKGRMDALEHKRRAAKRKFSTWKK